MGIRVLLGISLPFYLTRYMRVLDRSAGHEEDGAAAPRRGIHLEARALERDRLVLDHDVVLERQEGLGGRRRRAEQDADPPRRDCEPAGCMAAPRGFRTVAVCGGLAGRESSPERRRETQDGGDEES